MKSNETNITAYEIMFKDYPDVVGVKELSSMLGMCDKKIYQLIKHGNIPTIPCGRIIKVVGHCKAYSCAHNDCADASENVPEHIRRTLFLCAEFSEKVEFFLCAVLLHILRLDSMFYKFCVVSVHKYYLLKVCFGLYVDTKKRSGRF